MKLKEAPLFCLSESAQLLANDNKACGRINVVCLTSRWTSGVARRPLPQREVVFARCTKVCLFDYFFLFTPNIVPTITHP